MTDDTSRPEFRAWIDKQPQPNWPKLPLTHVTKGLLAGDIVREGRISPTKTDETLERRTSFFFYGRPAYRVHGDGAIKAAATCPFMFIFKPILLETADNIHAFDTGAFGRRMYSHVLMDEIKVGDYSLEKDPERPNKLISTMYPSTSDYYDADTSKISDIDTITNPDDFLARLYIDLIVSPGRNEPDDRVGTIEIEVSEHVSLDRYLDAVIVPDILWNEKYQTNWISDLSSKGTHVRVFRFLPGRSPDYYMHALEIETRKYYQETGSLW